MLKGLYTRLNIFGKKGGERGFTLVELMIVIAVIAILALVLLPKAGVLKNKAKESGLKINMALLEAEVTSVIDNFDATDPADIGLLETRIYTDINAALETTSMTQKLKNPFTGITGAVEEASRATGGAAIYFDGTDNDEASLDGAWVDTYDAYAGMIAFGAYQNTTTTKLEVKLIPYDASGNRITEMEKVISQ